MTLRIVFVALVALALSCAPHRDSSNDSGAVYRAALFEISKKIKARRDWKPVLVGWTEDGRVPEEICKLEILRSSLPTLREDTLSGFVAANRAQVRLDLELVPSGARRFLLLTKAEYGEIFRRGVEIEENWDRFYARFPDSFELLFFSSISFSDDQSQALVYCQLVGDSGGRGWLMLFHLNGQDWVMKGERVVRVG